MSFVDHKMIPDNPLVSIVVPIYNVRNYLQQCLDSVLGQTYQNMEILLIDDGSTDGSNRICDEYEKQDSRVRVFHTENRGLASARNQGMKYANGAYYAFIDSDDWIELHTIATLVKAAQEFDADVVIGKRCYEYVGRSIRPKQDDDKVRVFHGKDILPAYSNGSFGDVVWNKLYRRECWEAFQFPDGHNYEDVVITWRMMKSLSENEGTIVELEESFFHLRV